MYCSSSSDSITGKSHHRVERFAEHRADVRHVSLALSATARAPSTASSPLVGTSSPVSIFKVVDLPRAVRPQVAHQLARAERQS